MKKTAVCIPYFGKWPEWIDLYFYSCSKNTFIDWFIFTDCEDLNLDYKNVFFNFISFEDYCQRVSDKLHIEYKHTKAYKLCDLKPFYGYIHADLLEHYDFWGFGDVDIIWGDIKSFYNESKFDKYDVFSTHNDRVSGHFSIFRNNKKYKELCFSIPDWDKKLIDEKNYALDENDFSSLIFPETKNIKKFYSKIMMRFLGWKRAWEWYYSLFPVLHFVFQTKKKRIYFKEQHTTPILAKDGVLYEYDSESWVYENGKIFAERDKREAIYFHFMIYKKNTFRDDCFWKKNYYHITRQDLNKKIRIDKSGFHLV